MKIVKNKMKIIMIQESSLILENKPKAFDTKEKSLFILPLLLKCEGPGPLPPWRGACLGSQLTYEFFDFIDGLIMRLRFIIEKFPNGKRMTID